MHLICILGMINMDMNTVMSMISSVGFPIVAACAMAWFCYQTLQKMTENITRNNDLIEELIRTIKANENSKNGESN